MEIIGDAVSDAIIKLRIAIVIAKLDEIYLDIETILKLLEDQKDVKKNRNYNLYRNCLDRLC
jgi:hypothetical protein